MVSSAGCSAAERDDVREAAAAYRGQPSQALVGRIRPVPGARRRSWRVSFLGPARNRCRSVPADQCGQGRCVGENADYRFSCLDVALVGRCGPLEVPGGPGQPASAGGSRLEPQQAAGKMPGFRDLCDGDRSSVSSGRASLRPPSGRQTPGSTTARTGRVSTRPDRQSGRMPR